MEQPQEPTPQEKGTIDDLEGRTPQEEQVFIEKLCYELGRFNVPIN